MFYNFLVIVNIHILVWYGTDDLHTDYFSNHSSNITTSNHSNLKIRSFCHISKKSHVYAKFWQFFFYVDSMIYCVIPFIVMTTCNVFIIKSF